MNIFPSLNNKYYVIGQDFSNLEKCEGITKDGKKIYILKDDFDSLPYEVKEAFKNLSNLNMCDFEYFTLTPAEKKSSKC